MSHGICGWKRIQGRYCSPRDSRAGQQVDDPSRLFHFACGGLGEDHLRVDVDLEEDAKSQRCGSCHRRELILDGDESFCGVAVSRNVAIGRCDLLIDSSLFAAVLGVVLDHHESLLLNFQEA